MRVWPIIAVILLVVGVAVGAIPTTTPWGSSVNAGQHWDKLEQSYLPATEANPENGYWEADRITLAYIKTTQTEVTYHIYVDVSHLQTTIQEALIDFPLRRHKGVLGSYIVRPFIDTTGAVVLDSVHINSFFHLAWVSTADTLKSGNVTTGMGVGADSSVYQSTYGMLSQRLCNVAQSPYAPADSANGSGIPFRGVKGNLNLVDATGDTISQQCADRLVFTAIQAALIASAVSWNDIHLDVVITLPFSSAYMNTAEYMANEGRR